MVFQSEKASIPRQVSATHFMMDDITKQLVAKLINELQKEKSKKMIQSCLIDPVIKYIMDKIFPYLLGCAVVFALVLIMTITTISLVLYDIRVRKLSGASFSAPKLA